MFLHCVINIEHNVKQNIYTGMEMEIKSISEIKSKEVFENILGKNAF